jgi:hypothetical protein
MSIQPCCDCGGTLSTSPEKFGNTVASNAGHLPAIRFCNGGQTDRMREPSPCLI